MNAAHDVHHLRHAEAHGDAAQRVGVEIAYLRLGREKLDHVARGKRHRRVEVLVEADDDPVGSRLEEADQPRPQAGSAARGGREYEVRYEKKTGKSKAAVRKAVKKVGVSRKRWRNGWRAKTHKGCFTE